MWQCPGGCPAAECTWLGKEDGDPGTDEKNELGGIYAHYLWHYFLDFGNGDLGNQGVHQMDEARWGLGVRLPSKVSGMGGLLLFDDAKEGTSPPRSTSTRTRGRGDACSCSRCARG